MLARHEAPRALAAIKYLRHNLLADAELAGKLGSEATA
jgi:hypothetical protein